MSDSADPGTMALLDAFDRPEHDIQPAKEKRYVTGIGWCWMQDGEILEVIEQAT